MGDIGLFSMYPVKHITTLEGGLVISKHREVLEKIALQRAFGVDRTHGERKLPGQYDVNLLGFNYRMTDIQAALGAAQMKRAKEIVNERKNKPTSKYK